MQSTHYLLFDAKQVQDLANTHRNTFRTLQILEDYLQKRFYGMNTAIRAVILAAAAGESLLLIGPPGTAKSSLIRAFCEAMGFEPADSDDHRYFEYLLTQFTEPSELFGYYDLAKAQSESVLERKKDGMIQEARVVYLDEVFNASSAILNSLLAMINERFYHERGEVVETELEVLYGASNLIPESDDLRAFFDRFLLRHRVENVRAEQADLADMLRVGWDTTYHSDRRINRAERGRYGNGGGTAKAKQGAVSPTISVLAPKVREALLDDLRAFRRDVDQRGGRLLALNANGDPGQNFSAMLATFVRSMRQFRLGDMSNRRVVKFTNLLLVNLTYRLVTEAGTGSVSNRAETRIPYTDFGLLRFMLDVAELPSQHEGKLPPLEVKSWNLP